MSKEFKLPDFSEGFNEDLAHTESPIRDFKFEDTIEFDQGYEGVPGQNMLFYGMPIRKKTFTDTAPGLWMGVDYDGRAKFVVGDSSSSLNYDGGILFLKGTFIVGSSGTPTDEHIVIGADFIRTFNTSNEQTFELDSDGVIRFYDENGDLMGTINGDVVGSSDTLKISGGEAVQVDTLLTAFTGSQITSGTIDAKAATAAPSGGAAAFGLFSDAGFGIYGGTGAPTVAAAKGSLYLRRDGSGTNDRAYINTNGSTTWTAIVTVA